MIINYQDEKSKLPDFLIVGAARSGTTSLHYYLKEHPQVFMPTVQRSARQSNYRRGMSVVSVYLRENYCEHSDSV